MMINQGQVSLLMICLSVDDQSSRHRQDGLDVE